MNNNSTCRDVTCDQSVAERPRYYARQLITADDLTLEQDYFRSRLRLHNRLLHGWGVVCGADVCYVPSKVNPADKEPWLVMVQPGYILGPYGDEIYIDCERTIDLRSRGAVGMTGEPCGEIVDPWCSEVYEQRENGKLYVAVKYKQVATRPVRVQPLGCGCDDTSCENSRWRDGFEIRILTAWPDCNATPPNLSDLFTGPLPPCPPCPDEPWVVLAEITVDPDGKITKIDTCACKRLAVSFMNDWWACKEGTEAPVCKKFDEYGDIESGEEEERLKKFADQLQKQLRAQAYIIGYDVAIARGDARAVHAKNYLVKELGIDAGHIKTLPGVWPKPKSQLYICDPYAPPPPISTAVAAPSEEPAEPQAEPAESKDDTATSPAASPAVSMSPPSSRKQTRRK